MNSNHFHEIPKLLIHINSLEKILLLITLFGNSDIVGQGVQITPLRKKFKDERKRGKKGEIGKKIK